jgi:plastocyanin
VFDKQKGAAMMYTKKTFLFALVISFLVVGTVLSFSVSPALSGETLQLITLKGESGTVSPESLKAKLGTTVVWYNSGPGPVTIKFTTRLGIACSAPVNFYSDMFGNYESSAIPEGGTASICFIAEGEYNYTVRRLVTKGQDKPHEVVSGGKIISTK